MGSLILAKPQRQEHRDTENTDQHQHQE